MVIVHSKYYSTDIDICRFCNGVASVSGFNGRSYLIICNDDGDEISFVMCDKCFLKKYDLYKCDYDAIIIVSGNKNYQVDYIIRTND